LYTFPFKQNTKHFERVGDYFLTKKLASILAIIRTTFKNHTIYAKKLWVELRADSLYCII